MEFKVVMFGLLLVTVISAINADQCQQYKHLSGECKTCCYEKEHQMMDYLQETAANCTCMEPFHYPEPGTCHDSRSKCEKCCEEAEMNFAEFDKDQRDEFKCACENQDEDDEYFSKLGEGMLI